jgi:hypothetical protein
VRKSSLAVFAACALAVLAVGCGGGSGSTESSSTEIADVQKILPRPSHTLDKPELIQFSRKVCANITREIEEGFERFASEHGLESGEQPTQAEVREIGEEFQLPLMHKQDREMINAGKAPSAEDAQKIFEIGEDEIRKWNNRPAVAATDPGRVWARANPMLKSYGFITCVRDKPLVE